MSKLSTYLQQHQISQAAFAARVGLTQGSVSKLCKEAIEPSLSTALAIEAATGGFVPVESWKPFAGLADRGSHAAPSVGGFE